MEHSEKEERSSQESALVDRRDFLMKSGSGLCSIALTSMLAQSGLARTFGDGQASPDPLAHKSPHVKPRATSVIWLFMEGGPSHLDTFDPKPALATLAGKP